MTTNKINIFSSINLNSIHTSIKAIEKLKLARAQASSDLKKLLRFKIEQKKNMDVYFKLSSIIIISTYLFKYFSLYKLVNWKNPNFFKVNLNII